MLMIALAGCSAPPAPDTQISRIDPSPATAATTTNSGAASISADTNSGALARAAAASLSVSYPAESAGVTTAFPQTDADDPPVPPFGPFRIGEVVAAQALARAQQAAQAEATQVAAAALAAPAVEAAPAPAVDAAPADAAAAPPARVATSGGLPFDWSTSENYLVLGTDRRAEGGSWRTDSIMVIGLDRANARAAVFSVPRDTYIDIPGYGLGRINQADYMGERRTPDGGGPALVSAILEEHLGISTQHWVRIQMDGFIKFIDALGGVDVYLDCPFSEPILDLNTNAWTNFTLPAGANHLDGQDAYWFARLRYRETDIGRSSRQRAIIWALREQILSTNAILRLPQLYAAFRDTISTDLNLFDIIGLAQFGVSLKPENVRAGGLTLKDLQNYTTSQGAQVLIIGDPDHVRELVAHVWDQPAMADAYRKDGAKCEGGIVAPEATPTPEAPAVPDVAPAPDQPADATPAPQTNAPSGAPTVGGFSAAAAASATLADPLPLTGPVVDPVTGALFDPVTGYPLDAVSGQPYDPVTGQPITP